MPFFDTRTCSGQPSPPGDGDSPPRAPACRPGSRRRRSEPGGSRGQRGWRQAGAAELHPLQHSLLRDFATPCQMLFTFRSCSLCGVLASAGAVRGPVARRSQAVAQRSKEVLTKPAGHECVRYSCYRWQSPAAWPSAESVWPLPRATASAAIRAPTRPDPQPAAPSLRSRSRGTRQHSAGAAVRSSRSGVGVDPVKEHSQLTQRVVRNIQRKQCGPRSLQDSKGACAGGEDDDAELADARHVPSPHGLSPAMPMTLQKEVCRRRISRKETPSRRLHAISTPTGTMQVAPCDEPAA
jgi:hypothetical protein